MARSRLERLYYKHNYMTRVLRIGNYLYRKRVPILPNLIRLGLRVAFNSDVPVMMNVPKDVIFMHNGMGTVIHVDVRFRGPALINHNVTLGASYGHSDEAPEIGSYVFIGTGAIVLGDVKIGDCSTVGAGAVVLKDVPPLHTAVGVPAVVRPSNPDYIRRIFDVNPEDVLA
ncbi:MAG: serine O-acetyltransferase [Chloroflexota bacterium]